VLTKQSNNATVFPFDYRATSWRRLRRRLRKARIDREFAKYRRSRPQGFEQFSDDRVHLGADVFRDLSGAQVVNLHWVAGYCDYRAIFSDLLSRKPVVWTLHDMNAFTGGCHYDHGCAGFAARCGCCPQLGSSDERDLSARVWARKRHAIDSRSRVNPFRVVSPSRWLAAQAQRSALFRDQHVEVIPYGLDTSVYRPCDQASARRLHGLADGDRVILFLASGAGARRKGFRFLDQAVSGIADRRELVVVTVGGERPPSSGSYDHRHLGSVTDEERLAEVYSMADLFVIPSLEDNLPLACQEALACGTPVVGFAVGGIPDMVIDGQTGLLAPPKDAKALSQAIQRFFGDPALAERLSAGAREHAVREYSYAKNAAAYRALYESLV
jgi:glycosyltransferase involved in cell wall biosynthesis